MTEDENNPTSSNPETEGLDSLFGGLDLTPEWARETPGVQSAPASSPRGGGGRGPRAPGTSARRGLEGVRVKPRRDQSGGGDGRERHPEDGARGRGPRRGPPPPRLPVHVDFIPEKQRLSNVVKVIRQTHRVYPLNQIASKFMENPGFVSIKFTVKEKVPEGVDLHFHQCKANGLVFTDKNACLQYIVEHGLGAYYESETREVSPPSGNFICVGRHRGTGKLVGPPNWHGYQRRMEELRQEIAPNLPPDAFAGQIETVHDAEVVESWKKEASVQTFYRRIQDASPTLPPAPPPGPTPETSAPPKEEVESGEAEGSAETLESPTDDAGEANEETESSETTKQAPFEMTREQAEKEFLEKVAPRLMSQSRRVIMPGYLLPKLEDAALASLANHHLRREHDRPSSIVFALRPAFKHMRLHLFRHEGELMVSGVEPHPLPDDQKIAADLRAILDHVAAHPHCNAKNALEALSSETGEPTPELVSHFHWLIEKGHLLEFSDGSLALPRPKGGSRG